MLDAVQFQFDNKFSGDFGLIIASLNSESMQESMPLAYTLRASKTPRQKRFNFQGLEIEEQPTHSFTVFSSNGSPISLEIQREIFLWLTNRSGYKDFKLMGAGYEDITFRCTFTEIGKQYHLNSVVGINLTATFDGIFGYGKPKIYSFPNSKFADIDSDGFVARKIQNSDGTIRYEYPKIISDSDIIDDYVYPIVRFSIDGMSSGKDLIIVNTSDNAGGTRAFEFSGLPIIDPAYCYEVDNELQFVSQVDKTTGTPLFNSGDFVGCFNKNWLRLKRGVNQLKIRIAGTCTIEVPHYVLVGF